MPLIHPNSSVILANFSHLRRRNPEAASSATTSIEMFSTVRPCIRIYDEEVGHMGWQPSCRMRMWVAALSPLPAHHPTSLYAMNFI